MPLSHVASNYTFPPGPALAAEDAGAREAWATIEQLLLVLDSFINDICTLEATTELSIAHGQPTHPI